MNWGGQVRPPARVQRTLGGCFLTGPIIRKSASTSHCCLQRPSYGRKLVLSAKQTNFRKCNQKILKDERILLPSLPPKK